MSVRKKATWLLLLLATLFAMSGCVDQSGAGQEEAKSASSPETEQEGSGGKEERIVSTSVVICEILDSLDVDTVVGVPQSDSYELPKGYESAQKIGAPMSPDLEIISSLNPTCILSPVSLESSLSEQYGIINIDAYFVDLSSTEGMYHSIEELGKRLQKEAEAEELIQEYEEFMKEYRNKNQTEESPSVLVLMGLPGSYVVATEKSYAGSLVKLAGGRNVYEEEQVEPFLNINPEDMADRNPDMILLTSHAMPEQVEKMFEEEFAGNDIWKHFEAVQQGRVYTLSNEKFGMSANFKYQEALEDLEEILYHKEIQ